MHSHVHGVGTQGLNPYSHVAAAKTSAAQEAAATRRKLLRAAAELGGGELNEDAVEMLGAWQGSGGESRRGRSRAGPGQAEDDGGSRHEARISYYA